MSCRFYSFGLDELADEELLEMLVQDTAHTGKPIMGYNHLYFRKTYGDFELALTCVVNDENKRVDIERIDTHCQGRCVWQTKYNGSVGTAHDGQPRIMVSNYKTGSGVAVVHLTYEDLLPALITDERIVMQVIGMAESVDYFETEEAFYDAIPKPKYGPQLLPGMNTVMAINLFDKPDKDENPEDFSERQGYNLVVGTVKELYYGRFQADEDTEAVETFIKCIVDTQLGELEIDHGIDQVSPECREHLRVGSVIVATVCLSGDVAIFQYGNGFVRDEEHDLRVVEEALIKGNLDKLATIISDDCIYQSEVTSLTKVGKEEVLAHINYVHENTALHYVSTLATISALPDTPEAKGYRIGKRAIVLGNEKYGRESLVLVDYDENGAIMRIYIANDSDYRFVEDVAAPPGKSAELFTEPHERPSIETAVKARASLMNLLDWEDEEKIESVEERDDEQMQLLFEQVQTTAGRPCQTVKELEDHYKDLLQRKLSEAFGIDDPEFARMGIPFYRDIRFRFSSADLKEPEFQWELAKVLCLFEQMGNLRRGKENRDESN